MSADGRLTAEPEPVSFWALAAGGDASPIEGENYSGVPTFRDPAVLRRRPAPGARAASLAATAVAGYEGGRIPRGDAPRNGRTASSALAYKKHEGDPMDED